ncbi:restriction endonuclease subunit S [Mycolicibacterium litorale]|uniref:restriction endonuclease subunit S n=1 Tax=Mycolicibacterium litorale TaxID=758802 RepID=UPI00162927C5|nr:restriction endonuclease subunit S [Mycolicibacterium litorale]
MTPLPCVARWRFGQIKNLAEVTLGKMLQSNKSGDDTFANYMRAANVQPDGVLMLEPKQMWFSGKELDVLTLRRGDVVVVEGGVGGYGRAAYLSEDLEGWGFQNSINRLRPAADTDGRFLAYYLIALRAAGFIERYCNVVSMPHLTAEKLAAIPAPIPPADEQRAIADFLDRETARIDTLIEEQQQLVELLRERREATINAVFPDGGAETSRLRYSIDLAQTGPFGTQLSSTEYVEGGVPVINPTHLQNRSIFPDRAITVTTEKAEELSRFSFQTGDVVLGRKGEVDKSALVTEVEQGYICGSDSMLLRPSQNTDSKYLWWFLQSPSAHAQLERWSVGSTVAGLNQTAISMIVLPLPPFHEQRGTVAYLDDQTAKIDMLIAETERFIELSQERRSALITAAVTGQIDVRGEVA